MKKRTKKIFIVSGIIAAIIGAAIVIVYKGDEIVESVGDIIDNI